MSEYLKPTAMLLRFFNLKQPIKETMCSYCLSGRAGREIFGSWWQLTDFAALGPHGITRRAKYFPVWPDLSVDTHLSVRPPSFSFFLSSYIFSSSPLMEAYAGLCGFSRPCSCHCVHFLPGFFYVLSVLIRIRISKTHRCLLPVCKNTRVDDYHDVKQAYGYQKVFMNKHSLGVSYPVLEKRSLC